jgi:Zn-dependent peptidase ImmA (M78 family)/transcriptional regulator with XRE-family HTH domain
VSKVPVSQRLKSERKRIGLTLSEVAKRTGIGESSLSEFEHGHREPRLAQLQKLAELYRRSIAHFLDDAGPSPEIVLWRQKPEPNVATEIEAEFRQLCRQYHNLEVWCVERHPCQLPRAEGDAEAFTYPDAERLAYRVRSELCLGDRPGQSLFRVLEELCGVKLFYLSFEPSGTAASSVSEAFGAAVLLNAQNVRWRRNFDLAHELFHLLTWSIFRTPDTGDGIVASEREEKLATCFASNLLMPADATLLALQGAGRKGSILFADLFDIARQFDVSVEALLWRIHFLYKRKEEETKEDIDRCKAMSAFLQDRECDGPPLRPARFVALAMKALRQGQVSQGRFAEYLGISRREAMKIAEQEAREDEEVAIPSA